MLVGSGEPMAFDHVGTAIWLGLVEEGLRLQPLVTQLASTYGVDEPTVRGDVLRLVEQLVQQRYLAPRGDTT